MSTQTSGGGGQTEAESTLLDSIPTEIFVAGKWRRAEDGEVFDVVDPATGQILVKVASATKKDGVAALDAAVAAQDSWAHTAPRARAEILRAGFEAVLARADDFALLMTLEMGKSLVEARGEVEYAAEFLRWFGEEAPRISGRYAMSPDGVNRIMVLRKPVGPCLFITPWNFPLAMATRKIAPAIAAGCTMVVKPASQTPLSTLLFAQIMSEVGLPAGVLNVIPTHSSAEVTGPLIADSRLRKLSFTGSTGVGKKLLAQASENVLRTSMELGGNAPFLVFEDVDINAAVEGALAAKLRNIGEACTAANRFYVHKDVAEDFCGRLAERMSAMKVARGTEEGAELGPLIDEAAQENVDELVKDAVNLGATVLTGGKPVAGQGYFYEPTVLTSVPPEARVLREEIFGPVAPVVTFETEEEAIALANDTEYGLIAYAFTTDNARILRLAERLETGMLGVNSGVISNPAAPFGGVKQSGLGREGGAEGIEEFLETTYVGIANPFA